MSKRRKHIIESLRQNKLPLKPCQYVVRALGSRGDNLVEVVFPDGAQSLALLPARFKKKLWIRSGSFVVVQQEAFTKAPSEQGARISSTIEAVLFPEDVVEMKQLGCWPPEFISSTPVKAQAAAQQVQPDAGQDLEAGSDDNDLPPLLPNCNRPVLAYDFESSDSTEEDTPTQTAQTASRHTLQ